MSELLQPFLHSLNQYRNLCWELKLQQLTQTGLLPPWGLRSNGAKYVMTNNTVAIHFQWQGRFKMVWRQNAEGVALDWVVRESLRK